MCPCLLGLPYRHLGAVRGTDTTACGADLAVTELNLLEAIDGSVKVEVDVAAVGDEDTVVDIGEALRLELAELAEEAGDVEDNRGTDQVHAVGVDETGGEKVEVVLDAIGDCHTAVMSVIFAVGAHCVPGAPRRIRDLKPSRDTYRWSDQRCGRQRLWRRSGPWGRGCR